MVSEDLDRGADAALETPDASGRPDLAEQPDPPALAAFRRSVDSVVDQRLTPETVDARLARLKEAVDTRARHHREEDQDLLVERLARYAYQVVASWFTIIFDSGLPELPAGVSAITDRDVDDLARDTVARAIVGFREEMSGIRPWLDEDTPDVKRLFLLECLLHVPDAYRRWLRETDRVSWDDAEQIGTGSDVTYPAILLTELVNQVRNDRERVVYRLQRAGLPGAGRRVTNFSAAAANEIVEATLETLESAARDWLPEGGGNR